MVTRALPAWALTCPPPQYLLQGWGALDPHSLPLGDRQSRCRLRCRGLPHSPSETFFVFLLFCPSLSTYKIN